ncbi:MAG: hypothetical protein WAT67_00780 [Candidatus Contendobacter sp.]
MTLAQFNLDRAEIRDERTRGAGELAPRSLERLAEAARLGMAETCCVVEAAQPTFLA